MMAKFNSARKSAKTNTTFRIENSPAGKMEIRFEEKAGHKQIKVLVESEATRHELQKAVPQLQQNLNAKGVELISFTVQVGQFGNKAGQAAPHNKQGMRHKNKETKEVRHEADKSTVMKRNYGYNTIEVIA
jgi:flagellar hook-length control protein FliK